jgi:hypothetical protein
MTHSIDELWEEVEKLYGFLGYDLRYVAGAREVLILLNSKEPIEGLSKPPWRGLYEQFYTITEAVRNLERSLDESFHQLEITNGDPFYRNLMKEHELRIRKVISELQKIDSDAFNFHRDLRAQFVQSVPETYTEYVSEISDERMVEETLRSFLRSDTKRERFFLEFKSIPGAEFDIVLQKGKFCDHITISIGAEIDLESRHMEIISCVRDHMGLPPAYEFWEEDIQGMTVRVHQVPDERTLAKYLWPDAPFVPW